MHHADHRQHRPRHGVVSQKQPHILCGVVHRVARLPPGLHRRSQSYPSPQTNQVRFFASCFAFSTELFLNLGIYSFFGHLLDVLGPSEFLAPVCMLLIDKLANKVARQNAEEALASLALPLAVLQLHEVNFSLSLYPCLFVSLFFVCYVCVINRRGFHSRLLDY